MSAGKRVYTTKKSLSSVPDRITKNADILIANNVYSQQKGCLVRQSATLITDLKKSQDLLADATKTTRNLVNRSFSLPFSSVFISKPTDEDIAEFSKARAEFQISKSLPPDSSGTKSLLSSLNSKGMLLIYTQKYNGDVLSRHALVIGRNTVRSLFGWSAFREEKNQEKIALSCSNRRSYFDLLVFSKQQGFDFFDWGGYSTKPELASISEFKKTFGGQEKKTFYYEIPLSCKGKIYCFLKLICKKYNLKE